MEQLLRQEALQELLEQEQVHREQWETLRQSFELQQQQEQPVPAPVIDLSASTSDADVRPPDAVDAATSYIQKVGAAASQFMLNMSSATQEFVRDVRPVVAPAAVREREVESCSICYEALEEPHMGQCSHIYCRKCLTHAHMGTRLATERGISCLIVKRCPQCRGENIRFYRMLSVV